MPEFYETQVVVNSVGVQGPKGDSGIELGPTPPEDTTVLWADTDDNFAVVAGAPISGTGFPEGVVAAPVGQRYVDTNATNGAVEWIKASGSGSTGWKVIYGDTGWRRDDPANSWFLNGATPGAEGINSARFRRTGDTCMLMLGITLPSGWVNGTDTFAMPVGFRWPNIGAGSYMPGGGYGGHAINSIVNAGNTLKFYTGAVTNARYQWTWITNDLWPTTLPGFAG